MLPVTIFVFLCFIEAATDAYGITSDEEGIMYTAWLLLIVNAALFIFKSKWNEFVNKFFS